MTDVAVDALCARVRELEQEVGDLRAKLAKRPTQEEALEFLEDEIMDGTAAFECDSPRLLVDAIYERKAAESDR